MRRLLLAMLLFACWLPSQAALAGVTITFWSHDQDQEFPHAFFTLKGVPDSGGTPLDESHGFTAKAITPAILLGSVAGEVQSPKPGYIRRSDAQFAKVLSDAQLAAVQALVAAWRVDTKYNLNRRNCVHFIAEALRRSGVTVPNLQQLMKKPKSFLIAVGEANQGQVTQIRLDGKTYFAKHASANSLPADE